MNIYNTNNATAFISEVENFSKTKLKRKAELIRIFEEAAKQNKLKTFEELTFTAKYVQGLLRVVKKGAGNPEIKNIDSIKNDFSSNMNKVVEQLKTITSDSDEEMKKYFDENFFQLSQESFMNLNELLNDLEWVKMYSNSLKRN